MSNITLLDCTLRDGGYINDWNFGEKNIKSIIKKLSLCGTEIIEVGFLTNLAHTNDQSLYADTKELDRAAFYKGNSLIAAMIALGEKELDPISLPDKKDTLLDIIRITFHNNETEIQRAVSYARLLEEKGYKVCMQPVGTAFYTDKELLMLIEIINELNPFAFYLVDTLGSIYKNELIRLLYLIDYNLRDGIKLGFHSHNNLQLSFSNTQEIMAYDSKREFIIDSSAFGMGRGAGNLCTELICRYINTVKEKKYNLTPLLEVIDDYIQPIHSASPWGYSVHYYLAAMHNCHPSYASYLLNKQTLTMSDVNSILISIPKPKRHLFDKSVIRALYYEYQDKPVDEKEALSILKESISDRTVLAIAPGKNAKVYEKQINDFIDENSPIVITVNGEVGDFKSNYIFISNTKRFNFSDKNFASELIITSNLQKPSPETLCVSYSSLYGLGYDESDNSGMMLLRLLRNLGVAKVFLAGFDGFSEDVRDNYFSRDLISSITPESAKAKNAAVKAQLNDLKKDISISFLTPSKYEDK